MNIRELFVYLINYLRLPFRIMGCRILVKKYFDYKYRINDPYQINILPYDTRYYDMINLLIDKHFFRALDVGCGEGIFSKKLLEVCDLVDGIDISVSAIFRAKANYSNYRSLRFFVIDVVIDDIDLKYDLIVCAEILYYLKKRQLIDVIRKLDKWLVLGGYLLIGDIKKIQSNKGLFLSHINATEINQVVLEVSNYKVVRELDRGGDILLLLCKR